MSETKHAPGPWAEAQLAHGDWLIHQAGKKSKNGCKRHHVATVRRNDFSQENSADIPLPVEANARLIAAAPELLSACRDILSRFQDLLGPEGQRNGEIEGDAEAIKSARAAIAKAEGTDQ